MAPEETLDPVLLLERGRHADRRLAAQQEPHNVEEIDMILGVPKLVWVILLDLVALGCFVAAFQQVTRVAKKKPEDAKTTQPDVSEDYPGANYQYGDDDPNASAARSAFTASHNDYRDDFSPRNSEARSYMTQPPAYMTQQQQQQPFFSSQGQGDRRSFLSGFSGHGGGQARSPRTQQQSSSFFSGFSGHG